MVQRPALAQRNADHRLLGRCGRLGDGFRHFARLAVAEADPALAVADHHKRRKAAALPALHRLGHTVDVDELFDQPFALVLVAFATAIVPAATDVPTTAAIVAPPATPATPATLAPRRAEKRTVVND